MSHTPNYDAKLKAILDATAPGERTCALTGEKWMMTDEEIGWYRHFNVPPSALSPLTRWHRLNGHAVGFEWWWNKHAETGKPVLTYVHPATGVRVLPDKEWYEKDFISQAVELDNTQSFFDQLLKLRRAVPLPATLNTKDPQNSISLLSAGDVNSFFVIACRSKNCFLCSDGYGIESCAESYSVANATNCMRVLYGERLFNCRVAYHCFDVSNSAFLFDCRNCEFCLGATNKRNKKYLWFNKQLTQEEYTARINEVDLSSRENFNSYLQKFHQLMGSEGVWPENFSEKSPGCIGEYLRNATDCKVAFQCVDGPRDCFWAAYVNGPSERNAFVCGVWNGADNYQTCAAMESSKNLFCINVTRSDNLEYCIGCVNCEFCFGCVGLNRKKFCILNKQYDEGAYWLKVDEIKCRMLDTGIYGEFLNGDFCTSYYLDSVSGISLAATKDDQAKYGFPFFNPESCGAIGELGDVQSATDSEEVPDNISDLNIDQWAGKPLLDSQIGRRFAFLKPELEFYHEQKIAPPTRHFVSRVNNLYKTANQFLMEETTCQTCAKMIQVAKNVTFQNRKHLCHVCYLKYLEQYG